IPSDLRLDIFEIRERMLSSKDAIAKLIVSEIEQFARRLEAYQQRDLVCAPVWAPYEHERILELVPDGVKARLRSAYDRLRVIAGASQRLGVPSHHRGDLESLAAEFADVKQVLAGQTREGDTFIHDALFHLSMESCYARLLLSYIAWPEQRERE